ncbi:MAG: D-alanyl-D-alanine carboxypeptidase/D-alanyl-D-alanine-endopeptidase [Gemmatimonadota bacterium]
MSAVRRHAVAGLASLAAACGGARVPAPAPAPAPAAPNGREALVRAIDSLVRDPRFANAHWGVLVVHPARGDTLYAHNADKLFVPASNQKLVTGAVALAQLGPEFRTRTSVLARGPLRDGVLDGDLVLVGRGDPSWSDAMQGDALLPLHDLADSVRSRGIRRVRGRVVVATGHFRGPRLGFGWDWDDLEYAYGAPVDAVLLNEGLARLVVEGAARPGEPATVTVQPVAAAARVQSALGPTRATPDTAGLDVTWDDDARTYVVRGTVAVGQRVGLRVAMREPARAVAAAWLGALDARGVEVTGGVAVDTTAAMLAGDTLAVHASPPLADVLRFFEKPSQNQLGEQLLRVVGLERTGVGSADSGLAVVRRQLAAWGVDSTAAVARDGSGLSRHNFVAPRAVVRILDAMGRQEAWARVFRDALPLAGVDGTLASRMRGTAAQGTVQATTGFVDRVRSLSGYVTTRNGETLLFSALCNNWTTDVKAVERVQDEIAERLAAWRYRGPADDVRAAPAR